MDDYESPSSFEQSLSPRHPSEVRNILEEIRQNRFHSEWLGQNDDRIREAIKAGLEHDSLVLHALSSLLMLLPHLHAAYEEWTPIILTGIERSQQQHQVESVSRLYIALASFYTQTEQPARAEAMLSSVDSWFSLEMRHEVVAEMCICLVEVLLYRFDTPPQKQLLNTLLRRAEASNNPHLMARTQQLMCRVHIMEGDKERAIEIGRLALDYFTRLPDRYNMFRSALALAKAHRASQNYVTASRYLQIARSSAVDTITDKERGDLYYELGVIAYERAVIAEDTALYDEVVEHFQSARSYYEKTPMPYRCAAIYHAQGLLLTRMGKYDEAQVCLATAEKCWAQLKNHYQTVNALYGRSFNEAKRGALRRSRQLAEEAIAMVGGQPDTTHYNDLYEELQFHLRKLHTGFFPKADAE